MHVQVVFKYTGGPKIPLANHYIFVIVSAHRSYSLRLHEVDEVDGRSLVERAAATFFLYSACAAHDYNTVIVAGPKTVNPSNKNQSRGDGLLGGAAGNLSTTVVP